MTSSAAAALPSLAPRSVTILGCTGSIGLNMPRSHPSASIPAASRWKALTAHANSSMNSSNSPSRIQARARRHRPSKILLSRTQKSPRLHPHQNGRRGEKASIERPLPPQSTYVMAAIVGAAGLAPNHGRHLAAARISRSPTRNASSAAGDVLIGAEVPPLLTITRILVDSEHSAIFQVFDVLTGPKSGRENHPHRIRRPLPRIHAGADECRSRPNKPSNTPPGTWARKSPSIPRP